MVVTALQLFWHCEPLERRTLAEKGACRCPWCVGGTKKWYFQDNSYFTAAPAKTLWSSQCRASAIPTHAENLFAFATRFAIELGSSFVDTRTTDIEQDINVLKHFCGASSASCMMHVRVAKFVLHNPVSFDYFANHAASTLGFTHLDDKILASCSDYSATFWLKAASVHLSNHERSKSGFSCRPFFFVAYRYFETMFALFSAIRSFNNDMFADDGFTGFLASEVLFTRTMIRTVLKNF